MKNPPLPTLAQALTCFRICQQLTGLLLPIYVVRLDERTGNIYILAGEETQAEILPNGNPLFL
jgi:hypothetical protein